MARGFLKTTLKQRDGLEKQQTKGMPMPNTTLVFFTTLAWMGVPQELEEAVRWTRKSADQGHADAQYMLGFLYRTGQGVAQDLVKAARWNRKAAEQGLAKAQGDLALMYHEGNGVAQDHGEAARWFQKAADQGDAMSQFNLGHVYALGEGVTKDLENAVYWFRKAEEDQGDPDLSAKAKLRATCITALI
jgi:TPR repeat protein